MEGVEFSAQSQREAALGPRGWRPGVSRGKERRVPAVRPEDAQYGYNRTRKARRTDGTGGEGSRDYSRDSRIHGFITSTGRVNSEPFPSFLPTSTRINKISLLQNTLINVNLCPNKYR